MSERGKILFGQFIADLTRRPEAVDQPIEGLLSDLMDKCLADDIPFNEIVEEVGDVEQALAEALKAGRREIG